jgi:hypothetical protein
MLMFLLTIAWYALVVIGAWKMFEKAGVAGWKAIIPIYNIYLCFKFCWNTTYFWVWLVLSLLSVWADGYAYYSGYMSIVSYVISLVTVMITVNLAYHLSMSFGHGFWYALGLAFFPFIFTMIIGFGSSRYFGNTSHLIHS